MSKPTAVSSPPLGRPRGFDADAALRVAIKVFWQNGFEATSLDHLNRAMGLSRSSFYACFGSKHALLMAALRLYADERFAALSQQASAHTDPRAAVQAMLAEIAEVDGGTRGCLFVNAVAERAPGDDELLAFAQAHTGRVGALMTATLVRAGCSKVEAAQRAGALLALAIGVTTLRKTGVPASELTKLLVQADHLLPLTSPHSRRRNRA